MSLGMTGGPRLPIPKFKNLPKRQEKETGNPANSDSGNLTTPKIKTRIYEHVRTQSKERAAKRQDNKLKI
jgi:hypothetical protein